MLCSFYCIGIRDGVLDDFPKISDHCPKVSEECPKIAPKARRKFPNIFRKFPKIAEDFRGNSKMFRSYTRISVQLIRDKLDISEITDIFTSEDMENTPLESRM